MRPRRLWSLRKEIFGLGAAQVMGAGLLLTLTAMAAGLSAPVAFIAAMGFVLSSTAVIMQMLDERNELSTPAGQRAVSILLLEDHDELMLMTDSGKIIRMPINSISIISRNTQGVKLIGMEPDERVTGAARLAEKED